MSLDSLVMGLVRLRVIQIPISAMTAREIRAIARFSFSVERMLRYADWMGAAAQTFQLEMCIRDRCGSWHGGGYLC